MNPHLKALLFDGIEPPDEFDLNAALAETPQVAALWHDLKDIEAATSTLPSLTAPPELTLQVLDTVAQTEQLSSPPHAVVDVPDLPLPGNRTLKIRWFAGVVAIAAAVMLTIQVWPEGESIGDPDAMVPRGLDEPIGPGVHLRMTVRTHEGEVQRFARNKHYAPLNTLQFRYDASGDGWLHLVRVDHAGASLLHTQSIDSVSGDLQTIGGTVGYELEEGESAAVFALIRTSEPLDSASVDETFSVGIDVEAVCRAARQMGARCSAERVEAVQ